MKKIFIIFWLLAFNLAVYGQKCISPNGQLQTQTFNLKPFTKIQINVPSQVTVIYGKQYRITWQGSENILPHLKAQVNGGTLTLSYGKCLKKTNLNIQIQVPKLYEIDLNSVVDLRMDDNFDPVAVFTIKSTGVSTIHMNGYFSGALEFNLSGVTSLEMKVNKPLQVLNLEESGVSNVVISGNEVNKLFVKLSGTASADLSKLKADIAIIETSGMAVAKVYATGIFSAKASGLSSITFYGNPQVVTMKTTGLANIVNAQSE